MQIRPVYADMLHVRVKTDEEKEGVKQEAVTTVIDFQPL